MGFEFELRTRTARPPAASGGAGESLEARWHRSNARLAAAIGDCRRLAGQISLTHPDWHAAQLRVAEARASQQRLYEEIELLEAAGCDAPAEG